MAPQYKNNPETNTVSERDDVSRDILRAIESQSSCSKDCHMERVVSDIESRMVKHINSVDTRFSIVQNDIQSLRSHQDKQFAVISTNQASIKETLDKIVDQVATITNIHTEMHVEVRGLNESLAKNWEHTDTIKNSINDNRIAVSSIPSIKHDIERIEDRLSNVQVGAAKTEVTSSTNQQSITALPMLLIAIVTAAVTGLGVFFGMKD